MKVLVALLLLALPAHAQEVVRRKLPNSDFPILSAVEVPAGREHGVSERRRRPGA